MSRTHDYRVSAARENLQAMEVVFFRWMGSLKESDDARCGEVDLLPTGVLKLRYLQLPRTGQVRRIIVHCPAELTTSESHYSCSIKTHLCAQQLVGVGRSLQHFSELDDGSITFKMYFNYKIQITFLKSNSNRPTFFNYFGYDGQNTKYIS